MTEIKNPFLNLESSFSAPFCSVGRASGLDNKNYKLPTPTLRRLITDFVISVCVCGSDDCVSLPICSKNRAVMSKNGLIDFITNFTITIRVAWCN